MTFETAKTAPIPTRNLSVCHLCKLPVSLETAKTDETGKPVHEECYVLHISLLKK
jgi:hypothetical protein